MDEELENQTPQHWTTDQSKYTVFAQLVGATIIWFSCLLGIFVLKDYSAALFVCVPFVAGGVAAYLVSARFSISATTAIFISTKALMIGGAGIILFAIEGIICLFMAAPIAILVSIIAGALGHYFGREQYSKRKAAGLLFSPLLLFGFSFVPSQPQTYSVVTSVVVNAPPQAVWKNVVEFNKLPAPTEWLFKTGIAYPINATIDGRGVGAIRHCNFTTGSFVEPITVWDEPHLLAFSVKEQPEPMEELSPYNIDPAHLHGYFVSEKGQFKLTDLHNGTTLLEGTTWYHHKVAPEFYWHLWSDAIIHSIHNRVLGFVKLESERDAKAAN